MNQDTGETTETGAREGALKSLADLLHGIREGVKAVNEGRTRPWSEVEKELFGGDDE